jgi:hypothetical protein
MYHFRIRATTYSATYRCISIISKPGTDGLDLADENRTGPIIVARFTFSADRNPEVWVRI